MGELAKDEFCKGTPGAIPLLLEAIKVFPELKEKLLKIAQDAGDIVFNQGLLFEGRGLCHRGTAGNAYLLHSLYRFFNQMNKKERSSVGYEIQFNDLKVTESTYQQADLY